MKLLLIQTAFIGDVILATPILEKLHKFFPEAEIDFLLRKGNESLFEGHPFIHKLIVWDKKKNKLGNLLRISREVRKAKYDKIINLHRFASSGVIVFKSGAKEKIGFDKNPFSFCYTIKAKHIIGNNKHEIDRNLDLIASFTDAERVLPRLYPQSGDIEKVKQFKSNPYITTSPASVWFTKQYPPDKWAELINRVGNRFKIFLLGSPGDYELCGKIKNSVGTGTENLAGKLTLLQSAALMMDAQMNYMNDSAPLHLASAVNAPSAAVFCSTVPGFGFGPLSAVSHVVELQESLYCRPCGLHGFRSCPEKHFRCAKEINTDALLKCLP